MMKGKRTTIIYYSLLATALITVWLIQALPAGGKMYAQHIYPVVSRVLSTLSGWIPFSLGDLFILLSITGIILYPLYARLKKKTKWRKIALHIVTYLAGIYAWFYLAWGLNYSQPNFYRRTHTPYTAYTPENFREFLNEYIENLNATYVPYTEPGKAYIHKEILRQYALLSDSLGVHAPQGHPRVKNMLFSPLFSKMAVTGYMGPFFCEFNVNSEVLPSQYAETYAHELAHFLGIASEAEANFYAYQVCISSDNEIIRYGGYFSIFNSVLSNARRLLTKEEYNDMLGTIRPEIIEQALSNREYWTNKYSPVIGEVQNWLLDLYLKGNNIESGMKNYSEVVGLLISRREYEKKKEN